MSPFKTMNTRPKKTNILTFYYRKEGHNAGAGGMNECKRIKYMPAFRLYIIKNPRITA